MARYSTESDDSLGDVKRWSGQRLVRVDYQMERPSERSSVEVVGLIMLNSSRLVLRRMYVAGGSGAGAGSEARMQQIAGTSPNFTGCTYPPITITCRGTDRNSFTHNMQTVFLQQGQLVLPKALTRHG